MPAICLIHTWLCNKLQLKILSMTKLSYLISAFVITMSLASCNNQPKETVTETKTETIKEVPAPQQAPAPKETPAPKEVKEEKVVVKEKKSTSVKIGPNGGSLESDELNVEFNK